jgi:hypothetical protein
VRRTALLAVLLAAAGTLAAADAPVVSVALDKTSVSVGDRVTATYSARIPSGATLDVDSFVTPAPEEKDAAPAGPVLDYQRPSAPRVAMEKDGSAVWTLAVPVTPFAAGDVPVPGPHLVYTGPSGERTELRAASAVLHVASRLPQGKKPEALDPKADRGVRVPPHGWLFWTSIALALAALALLAWRLLRRRAEAPREVAAPPLPPAEELMLQLKRLEGETAKLGDDARPFYSELTHAAKRYLERRLDAPVLEWTTFETVRRLRDRGLEPPREIGLSELLGAADRVKFGKGRATREEARAHVERARLLCRHVESVLSPPPVEETPEKAS